jgi:hypothetical protein
MLKMEAQKPSFSEKLGFLPFSVSCSRLNQSAKIGVQVLTFYALRLPFSISSEHDNHESPQSQDGPKPRQPYDIHDDNPILPRCRVVVVTIQQEPING